MYNAMFLEMSEGNQTKETVETEIDPDCPEKYTTNTALPHAQLPDDGKGNFTHTPKRLKKMNDDEMSEMRKSGRELEEAMLNETIAKFCALLCLRRGFPIDFGQPQMLFLCFWRRAVFLSVS